MIYLTTGANGAGKTLLTLRDVRAQQLAENRPVYYHGFELDEAKAVEFGWQLFDPKKWQDLPDGSICIMDECQNEFPLRRSGSEVPDYINAIAQFRRKRGFDFWLITPHPSLIDVFVRRLIDKPSWHRHLKRTFGADLVSEIKFSSPDLKCEEPGSASRGELRMVPYPKEVYTWYRSASLHTGKRKIPRAVYVALGAAIIVPLLGYLAFSMLPGGSKSKTPIAPTSAPTSQVPGPSAKPPPVSAPDFVASFIPRVPGLPHTAPRYDELTKPVDAPRPAACLATADRCQCYTQQGTRIDAPDDMCRQFSRGGYFVDWQVEAAQAPPLPVKQTVPAPVAQGGSLTIASGPPIFSDNSPRGSPKQ